MFREILKKQRVVRNVCRMLTAVRPFFRLNIFLFVRRYIWFINEYFSFKILGENKNFKKIEWFPQLNDNLTYTPLDPTYFYQDSWAAKQLFKLKPKHHYDVGSSAKTIGILSQFTPITMVDIRPIELKLDNLFFKQGSILNLPFEDNSLETISSLCVVEHIGLGRYGDALDPFGSEKAIKELQRVLKVGGIILFSVPIDRENTIYFNAHRAFTKSYIVELFTDFELLEEKYQYGVEMHDQYDASKGFGTGLYMWKKTANVI